MVYISLPEHIILQPLQITQEAIIWDFIYPLAESMHTSTCSFFPATINLLNELLSQIANAPTIDIFVIYFIVIAIIAIFIVEFHNCYCKAHHRNLIKTLKFS